MLGGLGALLASWPGWTSLAQLTYVFCPREREQAQRHGGFSPCGRVLGTAVGLGQLVVP